ncbi:MAG: pyridoxamine 5'-phosphate oxidase family protein [Chloroflexi bacterium]|nr:pyridoxamine 5'-phosphate oxidase family protein [Chloroflexota bacterium]MCI0649044.1 pyridoxamine 5'-phosphate oxidase family protein [Chloroflexota bacterium]MCI0725163.1 pyridoxamine 5'-phosphate oxidase family protein [Chloroflexota bacterium]
MRRNPARWRAIEARLGREATIWLATVRADGRPHLAPVWYVWLDGKVYLATGTETQKFTNLRANQQVALALPDTTSVIVIEGEAHAADRNTTNNLAEYFFHKYEWDFRYDDTADWRLIEITPRKILAWGDGYDEEGTRVL